MESGFKLSDHVVEGELKVGGQEHFYLETQASIVIPKEDSEFEVFSSCQSPSSAQVINANTNAKTTLCLILCVAHFRDESMLSFFIFCAIDCILAECKNLSLTC